VAAKNMRENVYKIFTEKQWTDFQGAGQFHGSEDDLRDGFIHLATKEQTAGVVDRFFSGEGRLYVAEFSNPAFLTRLTWEASGSKEVYPHLYNSPLFTSEVNDFAVL
jgi:uncharacterized protein (DUF952 family)